MLYLLLFAVLAAAVFQYFRTRFVPAEVALNDKDITANGAQDSLRKAYHNKRSRVRGFTVAGLSAAAGAPLAFVSWWGYGLGTAAVAVLLTAYLSRYFTPLLNLARRAAGRTDIGEYYASPDGATWPDAGIYKALRKAHPTYSNAELLPLAAAALKKLLSRIWWLGLATAGALAVGAGWVALAAR